jgi:glutaredoxin
MESRNWLLIGVIAFGAWQWHHSHSRQHGAADSSGFADEMSVDQLKQLASAVKTNEVVIYTTTHCPYCAQAKSWMSQYGFVYTECDTDVSSTCAAELRALGGNGVPYLVVRGHHMKDGFDSDEFVAALRT